MTSGRDYLDYFQDIVDMMDTVQKLVAGMTYDEFLQDQRTKLAVTKAIEIIGEAAKNIPGSVRDGYPNVPWRQMSGMRDKLTHAYFGIDFEIVWKTASELIPTLTPVVRDVLESETKRGRSAGS
jgi:uncharacterized protein with HEPN domain